MKKKKVLVAMSGGVDSSAAALLLSECGFEVTGVTFRMYREEGKTSCCSEKDIEDAKAICERLGFPHHVVDLQDEFKKNVISDFANVYSIGKTPNPCVVCNSKIKFVHLYKLAEELGCDNIATGHYVKQVKLSTGRYTLRKADDLRKDQTYVLYRLPQNIIEKLIFPLYSLRKPEIRAYAEKNGFINADKPDSQDICFVRDGDYTSFLHGECGLPEMPGSFVDKTGKVLGSHNGFYGYTIGQRKGIGISFDRAMYVTKKNPSDYSITLGGNEDLYTSELVAESLCWMSVSGLFEPMRVSAVTRYHNPPCRSTIYPLENGEVRVVFDHPQRAATPGQSVVFYSRDMIVGGGFIK